MKNYKVKALRNFTDGLEKIDRKQNDVFECDKERYEFLKSKVAVELVEIQKTVDEIIEEEPLKENVEQIEQPKEDKVVEEIISKKKKSSKK